MTSWNWRSSYAKKWYIARQNEFFRRIKQRICSFSTIRLWKSSLTNSMRSESKSIIRTRSTKNCIVIWRTFIQMMHLICMRKSVKSNSCLRSERKWKRKCTYDRWICEREQNYRRIFSCSLILVFLFHVHACRIIYFYYYDEVFIVFESVNTMKEMMFFVAFVCDEKEYDSRYISV
jgi:hypothetical protein